MAEAYHSDAESDWFDKDEDDLVKDLTEKMNFVDSPKEEDFIAHKLKDTSSDGTSKSFVPTPNVPRFSLEKLLHLSKSEALDAFLDIYTNDKVDFFNGQIIAGKDFTRLLIYLKIYALLCDLPFPIYRHEMLTKLSHNHVLLDQIPLLGAKIMNGYKKKSGDAKIFFESLINLFCQIYKEGLLNSKCEQIMHYLLNALLGSEILNKLPTCQTFINEMYQILEDKQQGKYADEDEKFHGILPTLDEILKPYETPEVLPAVKKGDVIGYIQRQKYMMRQEFLAVMRDHVQLLRTNERSRSTLLIEKVHIKCSKVFEDAQMHEKIFVDLMSISDNLRDFLRELKNGSLLCFTSSLEFENLVFAVFHSTNAQALEEGHIGIQIVRQFKIGNIYDKPLLMFEAPTFYEPIRYAYENLKCFQLQKALPFQHYLVNKQREKHSPAYLKANAKYTYIDGKYELKEENMQKQELQLNDGQLKAYKNAFTQEMCLIQGPPGTGKTHLTVRLVRTLMENVGETPIVLLTHRNSSLDNVLLKLLDLPSSDILRCGGQTSSPELDILTEKVQGKYFTFEPKLKKLRFSVMREMMESLNELIRLQEQSDEISEHFELIAKEQYRMQVAEAKLKCIDNIFPYYLARDKRLIAMTTTSAAKRHPMFELLKSAVVIFEEAGEIQESHTIACLTRDTQHVIMIGDQHQSQPISSSHEHRLIWNLNISLYERLINEGLPYLQLLEQYRMGPNIAELLTPLFYNTLHNAPPVYNSRNVRNMMKNLFFLAHDVLESGNSYEKSTSNDYEVTKLLQLHEYLTKVSGYKTHEMVILTPYAKQLENLRNAFRRKKYEGRIFTIDSFQGCEADIVLLSLVRSNTKNSIGFLSDRHKICVALSRARIGLYIIGNLELLASSSSDWQCIQCNLAKQDAIGTEFPYEITKPTRNS